ncbi:MAG: CoA-binding protein [Nanoarchaeota archaeon]|nr:CoA-binding protein [Nanoarchaeota archaeon]
MVRKKSKKVVPKKSKQKVRTSTRLKAAAKQTSKRVSSIRSPKGPHRLDQFFNPQSVAIIGVSRSPHKVGHVIFRNFIENKFQGKIIPINPEINELLGYRVYPTILDAPGSIDLAVLAVPAPITPKILEQCGKKGVKNVILIAGGFKEVGNEDLEKNVQRTLIKYKMRAIGVNCLGIYDTTSLVDTIFLPKYKLGRPEKGNISFMTQSGAVGTAVMDWFAMKGYKMAKFISYGNATDVDEADILEYLGQDPETKVICVYIEGVREGRKFFNIAKEVATQKPVIILKGGITDVGNAATMSHTGSLAGSIEIYKAAFKQAGIIEADDIEQLFDYARLLSKDMLPEGNRIQIITDGGGFGVLAVDWAVKTGLQLAQLSPKSVATLKKVLPHYAVIGNPIDLVGDASAERYREAINATLDDENIDVVVVIALLQVPTLTAEIADVVASAADQKKKPLIVISAGGDFSETIKKSMEEFGVPTFSYPERALEAVSALVKFSKIQKQPTKLKRISKAVKR